MKLSLLLALMEETQGIGGMDDKDVYGGLLGVTPSLELTVSTRRALDSISTQAVMELAIEQSASKTAKTCMGELVRNLQFPKRKKATDVSVAISYPNARQHWGTIGSGTLGGNTSYGQAPRPKPPQL